MPFNEQAPLWAGASSALGDTPFHIPAPAPRSHLVQTLPPAAAQDLSAVLARLEYVEHRLVLLEQHLLALEQPWWRRLAIRLQRFWKRV